VQARWKVYVVDECHMLSTAAFNALLKTLEEPPPRVVFVLATTDPQRVLPTILSRCQRFDFRRIPLDALEKHLGWIAEQESIGITVEALHVVAQRAQGGLRDAESLLDQLSLLPAPIEASAVWELLGAVPEQELLALAQALAGSEPLELLEACRTLLERGREPAAVLQGLAGLLRDLVLAGVAPDRLELTGFSPQFRGQLPELARGIGKAKLLQWQAQLKGSEQQLRQSVNPRLWLEVLLLGLLAEAPAVAAAPAAANRVAATPRAVATATAEARPAPATAPVPAPATGSATSAAPAVTPAAHAPPTPPAAQSPTPESQPTTNPLSEPERSLPELWQQVLAGLELPSTRMLLSQQAQLVRLDEHRAVVRVAGNWMAMVQSRLPLLQQAFTKALGGNRQLVLEGGEGPVVPAVPAPGAAPKPQLPVVQPPPAPAAPHAAAPAVGAPASPQPPAPTISRPAPAAAPVEAPPAATPSAASTPAPAIPQALPAQPQPSLALDEKAKRLAEFFNGEVIEFDGLIEDSSNAA